MFVFLFLARILATNGSYAASGRSLWMAIPTARCYLFSLRINRMRASRRNPSIESMIRVLILA